MKKLFLTSVSVMLALITFGQTADKKFNVGLYGGLAQYNGDLGQGFFKFDNPSRGFFGLSGSYFLGQHFDVSLLLTKGEVGQRTAGKPYSESFRASMSSASLLMRFNFVGSDAPVRPFIYGGLGVILFEKRYTVTKIRQDISLPSFGGGISFRLSPTLNLLVQESFMYSSSDDIDGIVHKYNDGYLQHTAGITFDLGKTKDSDLDGVSDRKDKCSETPTGVKVDDSGCPVDKDKDGVADYMDNCPNVAGAVTLNGCPDGDKDGIADNEDQCPEVAGIANLKGCPDKDGDGIADKDDKCPDMVGTIALKGCPDGDGDGVADLDDKCANTKQGYAVDANGCPMDTDGDGIINEEDQCPSAAGNMALKGCPDTDADGVSDFYDKCPKIKGSLQNSGCPEIAKADIIKVTTIASKIFFEFDKATLTAASLPQLDALTEILKKYEGANLFLEGHTDNVGEDKYNMDLSQQRMDAVKAFLMSKGVFESRIYANGFGESRPIATNDTDAGRSKNRRVEMKLNYSQPVKP